MNVSEKIAIADFVPMSRPDLTDSRVLRRQQQNLTRLTHHDSSTSACWDRTRLALAGIGVGVALKPSPTDSGRREIAAADSARPVPESLTRPRLFILGGAAREFDIRIRLFLHTKSCRTGFVEFLTDFVTRLYRPPFPAYLRHVGFSASRSSRRCDASRKQRRYGVGKYR